jgi:hypothetical protein
MKEIHGHIISYQTPPGTTAYPEMIYVLKKATSTATTEVAQAITDFKEFPKIECPMTAAQFDKDNTEQSQYQEGLFEKSAQLFYRHYYDPQRPKQPTSSTILKNEEVALANLKKCSPVAYWFMQSVLWRFSHDMPGKICAYNDMVDS